jgi:ABC-type Fe3+-hydroxamate transport system substrate-binding protein
MRTNQEHPLQNIQKTREEEIMKNTKIVLVAVIVSLALGLFACAQQQGSASKPGGVVVEVTEWSGKVTAVDYQKQTVTLQGPDGKVVTLNAKNARNLDQMKVGDIVKAEYIEERAIFVRKADQPPTADEEQTVQLAPKGKMPAGVVADTVQITANVEAIDYQKRTVILKGPEGNVRTIKVEGVKHLDQIKVGDQVVVRVTEAFALSVVKP